MTDETLIRRIDRADGAESLERWGLAKWRLADDEKEHRRLEQALEVGVGIRNNFAIYELPDPPKALF